MEVDYPVSGILKNVNPGSGPLKNGIFAAKEDNYGGRPCDYSHLQ
jgi:hypothetical protein